MNYLEKWLDVPKVILQYVQLKLHTEKNLVHVCSYSLHVLLILSPMRYTKEIYYACKTRHSYSYSLFALSLNMKQYFFFMLRSSPRNARMSRMSRSSESRSHWRYSEREDKTASPPVCLALLSSVAVTISSPYFSVKTTMVIRNVCVRNILTNQWEGSCHRCLARN